VHKLLGVSNLSAVTSAAITSISAELVSVPVEPSAGFSTRTVNHREYVIVRVRDEDGTTEGIGYTYAGNSAGRLVVDIVNDLIRPILIGREAGAIEQNWDLVYREFLLIGRRGALLRALSAVDIALWDLAAKAAGRPLRELLGGVADVVEAYASGGYYRPGDPVQLVTGEVERYVALGFEDYKMKFGGLPLADDVARVAAAREALGPGRRLALDINNGWNDVTEAMRAIAAVEEFDIWWVEEPFLPDDIRSHRRLNQRSPIPIATGEIEATRWAFAELIEQGAADILQPDANVCGGVTEWIRIARMAESFGIPVAPHWHANLHAELAACTPNCITVEYFALAEGIYNFEALVEKPLEVADGQIVLGNAPGIGFDLDPEQLERYSVPPLN
jgi:L-alanine-DL-glutamate epimerase-like enolase superfamily enzyme